MGQEVYVKPDMPNIWLEFDGTNVLCSIYLLQK